MLFKEPFKLSFKQFWNVYFKTFHFLQISYLFTFIFNWKYPFLSQYKDPGYDMSDIGRYLHYHSQTYNLEGFITLIGVFVCIPFLYSIIRRRVRDMKSNEPLFITFIFFVPLSIFSITGLAVFNNNVYRFLHICVSRLHYNFIMYGDLRILDSPTPWFNSELFIIITLMLLVPYLIILLTNKPHKNY